jgi:TPR repeat protein
LIYDAPCRICKLNKVRRPVSNRYDEKDNNVWHASYFCVYIPCAECKEREIERLRLEKDSWLKQLKLEVKQLGLEAEGGNAESAFQLGEHYFWGDRESAFHWYSRGAGLGHAEAQNNLRTMFLRGLGCVTDETQAAYWYRKSAEQGSAAGQFNLANRYLHGQGVEVDHGEAYKWFAMAASQGNLHATREIGTMHRFGQGMERDLVAAAEFHLVAAEGADELALRRLQEYKDGTRTTGIVRR